MSLEKEKGQQNADAASVLPAAPLTLEGARVLHQVWRLRWSAWRQLAGAEKTRILQEASYLLAPAENAEATALYSILGHKGDFLFVHFRDTFEELLEFQQALNRLRLREYLRPAGSYVSVVELGLYESSVKLYRGLMARGVPPHSDEWEREVAETLERQQAAMHSRLFPRVPAARFLCFYPMERRRGEEKNWYTLPIEERRRQMAAHGAVGRRYAGQVQQIISGSIGLDDAEWGVDLFGDDPVAFKKLITEMRYDEVSGVYSTFGNFYLGRRCSVADWTHLLGESGEVGESGEDNGR